MHHRGGKNDPLGPLTYSGSVGYGTMAVIVGYANSQTLSRFLEACGKRLIMPYRYCIIRLRKLSQPRCHVRTGMAYEHAFFLVQPPLS